MGEQIARLVLTLQVAVATRKAMQPFIIQTPKSSPFPLRTGAIKIARISVTFMAARPQKIDTAVRAGDFVNRKPFYRADGVKRIVRIPVNASIVDDPVLGRCFAQALQRTKLSFEH